MGKNFIKTYIKILLFSFLLVSLLDYLAQQHLGSKFIISSIKEVIFILFIIANIVIYYLVLLIIVKLKTLFTAQNNSFKGLWMKIHINIISLLCYRDIFFSLTLMMFMKWYMIHIQLIVRPIYDLITTSPSN